MSGNLSGTARQHWLLVLLAAIALPLLFGHLGADALWADEGDTGVLAANTVKFGVPKAWDGVTFTDSDRGARVNDDLVMVSHPWLQYYIAAGSIAVFGQNAFAARLPFALCGWLTLFLVYALALQVSGKRAAVVATMLTLLSFQFILYSRQCRYYALNMLLSCVLLLVFLRLRTWRSAALFALVAVLIFHAHPIGFAIVAALGAVTLLPYFAAQRKFFWSTLPVMLALTLPWLLLAPHGHGESAADLRTLGQFIARLTQYGIECTSLTPLIGCCVLLVFAWRKSLLTRDDGALLLIVFATLAAYSGAIVLTQSARSVWYTGLRYTPAAVALIALAAGTLIARVSRDRAAPITALVILFAFTRLAQLQPWIAFSKDVDPPDEKRLVAFHVAAQPVDRLIDRSEFFFLGDFARKNPGTVASAAEYLRTHGERRDILITNYEWDPLYFHTHLPQGVKILPHYPIFDAARRKALPDYVFTVADARWLLWRPVWDGYLEYHGEDIERAIAAAGGRTTEVATFPETIWENRENVHFRRFSGSRHLFRWPDDLPDARLFRVDWQ